MLLSYNRLVKLVNSGTINADINSINGASIDITLDNTIMVERPYPNYLSVSNVFPSVDLKNKQNIQTIEREFDSYIMVPGEFLLASSIETFNLPNYIACEYKLKSSLARNGLQHMLAGWCDPGWNNSKLTLELKNVNRYNNLILRAGMKIGQVVFFECEPVPEEKSYAVKGQYNDQDKVTSSKGVR